MQLWNEKYKNLTLETQCVNSLFEQLHQETPPRAAE